MLQRHYLTQPFGIPQNKQAPKKNKSPFYRFLRPCGGWYHEEAGTLILECADGRGFPTQTWALPIRGRIMMSLTTCTRQEGCFFLFWWHLIFYQLGSFAILVKRKPCTSIHFSPHDRPLRRLTNQAFLTSINSQTPYLSLSLSQSILSQQQIDYIDLLSITILAWA